MVKPSRCSRLTPLLALAWAGLLAGCAVVPKSRLDECHKMSRNLQARNDQLKDSVLSLRSQYEDLAQRADDDARRLTIQDDEILRLTTSIQLYQEERDKLGTDFERLKRLAQGTTNPLSATLRERLETFAHSHPGCEFDALTGVMTFASDVLFEPGTDRPRPEARAWLQAYADLVNDAEARGFRLRVSGHTDTSAVKPAGLRAGVPRAGHLSLDRAARVRDLLAEARLDPTRVEVAGFEASRPRDDGPDEASRARNRRIEIELRRGTETGAPAAAVESGP